MDGKKRCKYREKCYRTNPEHLEEYDHSPQKAAKPTAESPTGKRKRKVDSSQERNMKQTKLNFVRIAKPLDVQKGEGNVLRRSPRKLDKGVSKRKGHSPRKTKPVFDADVEEKIVTKRVETQRNSENDAEDDLKIDEEEEDAKPVDVTRRHEVKATIGDVPINNQQRQKKYLRRRRPKPQGQHVTRVEESSDDDVEPEGKGKETEKRIPAPVASDASESDAEESAIPCNTPQEKIKRLFLVDMPDDFYQLYEYFKSIDGRNPKNAMKKYGIKLVGPFDVLSGELSPGDVPRDKALCHWRFYLDPPEFQTVIVTEDAHYGYWRDEPSTLRPFVVSNSPPDPTINAYAPNLFAAVRLLLEAYIRAANVFDANAASRTLAELKKYCGQHKIALTDSSDPAMLTRKKTVVARTFHQLGIVVPYNKKTEVGYRPLIETNARLKQLCMGVMKAKTESAANAKMIEIERLVNAANIANDECDFGNGLELGIDLFCMNSNYFRSSVEHLLTTSYMLVDRSEFAKIIKAHLRHRTMSTEPSALRGANSTHQPQNSSQQSPPSPKIKTDGTRKGVISPSASENEEDQPTIKTNAVSPSGSECKAHLPGGVRRIVPSSDHEDEMDNQTRKKLRTNEVSPSESGSD